MPFVDPAQFTTVLQKGCDPSKQIALTHKSSGRGSEAI